jgi:hypothetical protein
MIYHPAPAGTAGAFVTQVTHIQFLLFMKNRIFEVTVCALAVLFIVTCAQLYIPVLDQTLSPAGREIVLVISFSGVSIIILTSFLLSAYYRIKSYFNLA